MPQIDILRRGLGPNWRKCHSYIVYRHGTNNLIVSPYCPTYQHCFMSNKLDERAAIDERAGRLIRTSRH